MSKRNTGIELLRIVSMVMIMILHILGQGGVLKNNVPFSINFQISWFMESLTIVAVNCYALITGYVMINGHYKIKRLFSLWAQVIFYSWLTLLIFGLIDPTNMGLKELLISIFPVSFKGYWYFNAYIVLFIFVPLINKAIKSLSKKQYGIIILSSILIFSIITFITRRDAFYIEGGESGAWLIVLYLFGAYFKLYNPFLKFSKLKLICLYLLFSIMTLLLINFIIFIKLKVLNIHSTYAGVALNYNSIFVLLASIALFNFFVKLEISNSRIRSIILVIAPLAFSAYLLQTNILVFGWLRNIFSWISNLSAIEIVLSVLGIALSHFAIAIIIEYVRVYIFKMNILTGKFFDWMGNKFMNILRRIKINY